MSFLCVSVVQNKATKELSEPIHISKTWKESSSGKGKAQGCARNNCLETWCARRLAGLSVGARNKSNTPDKSKENGLQIRKFANSRSQVNSNTDFAGAPKARRPSFYLPPLGLLMLNATKEPPPFWAGSMQLDVFDALRNGVVGLWIE